MSNAWGVSFGSAWGISWGTSAPIVLTGNPIKVLGILYAPNISGFQTQAQLSGILQKPIIGGEHE